MPSAGIGLQVQDKDKWLKMKMILTILVTSLGSIAFASVDEEALLRKKAALVARKVHIKNLNLIGVNPETCKSTDSDKLIIKQIKKIKSSSLNHCATVVESVLRPLNDELAKVNAGVLVYAPLPKTAVPLKSFPADEPVMNNPDQNFETSQPKEMPLAQGFDPNELVGSTGLTVSDVDRIFETYEINKKKYRPSEDDDLFNILSKAYVRNLNRLIERKKDY